MVQRVPLQVRDATVADTAALLALWSASVQHRAPTAGTPFDAVPWRRPAEEEAVAAITAYLGQAERRLWVAVAEEEIVGVAAAMWRTVSPLHLTRMVLVTELEVAPSWRRRSVGSMLLSTAAGWAEQLDSEIILTFAGHRQRESARFLTKLGFAQVVTGRAVQTGVLRARLAARSSPARGLPSRGAARKIAVRRALRRRVPDETLSPEAASPGAEDPAPA